MKLYYCGFDKPRDPELGNFGDKLNPKLWPKLIPNILDNDETVVFVGIGTLINKRLEKKLPNTRLRLIFSSGVGYGKHLKKLDETYKVYCVRGPVSAKLLGLPREMAIIDGGVLVKNYFKPEGQIKTKYKYSYMPHVNFAGVGWEKVCKSLNFGYISPLWPTEKIISSICQTEILLAEAMHGAIVADAFRVPWVPVTSHPTILSVKWEDWCASVNLEYEPMSLERLHDPNPVKDRLTPIRSVRDWYRQKAAAFQLESLAKNARPNLSKESHLESLILRLEEKIEQFKSDYQAGYFSNYLQKINS